MKVLGIMGSPRIKGNTDLLIDEALNGAQSEGAEVEKVVVDKLKITPCKEYYACEKDGNCVIKDDMDAMYSKLLEAKRHSAKLEPNSRPNVDSLPTNQSAQNKSWIHSFYPKVFRG